MGLKYLIPLLSCTLNKPMNFRKKFAQYLLVIFNILIINILYSCNKCTTCKISNDGTGQEKTYPEYCASKDDVERFKEDVAAEASANFSRYSCNDK
jgi:hypothetical protein